MSEKRFVKDHSYLVNYDKYCILDKEQHKHLYLDEVCKKLNEQQATIITLKRRLEKINGGYGHLTHRNGLTANEWLIESQERELKKKNEQISDWIERHSKDIATICEQQATISRLEEENEQLQKENSILNRNEDDLKECTLENIQLKEENEQLRNELDNFNPVMFQDMRYGTVTLYSKGGIDE